MGKWNNVLSTYLDSKHFFRGRPQVSGIAFQKRSQPAERVYSTESLEDTVFPILSGGIRMFHCQLCIFLFVFLRLAACP